MLFLLFFHFNIRLYSKLSVSKVPTLTLSTYILPWPNIGILDLRWLGDQNYNSSQYELPSEKTLQYKLPAFEFTEPEEYAYRRRESE